MARSLRVALGAGVLSAGMLVGLGAGLAAADSSTRGNPNGGKRTATSNSTIAPLPSSTKRSILPPHLQHMIDDPKYHKSLLNLLSQSIVLHG